MLKSLRTYLRIKSLRKKSKPILNLEEKSDILQLINDSNRLLEQAASSAMNIKSYALSANLSDIRRQLIVEKYRMTNENPELSGGYDRQFNYEGDYESREAQIMSAELKHESE